MKKHLFVLPLMALLSLTACTQQATSQPKIDTGNPNQANRISERRETHFKIPKKDLKSPDYVKSGKIQKPKQFTYSKVGAKVTLKAQHPVQQTFKVGNLTYSFNQARLFSNSDNSNESAKLAQQALKLNTLPKNYQTLLIKTRITNNGREPAILNGLDYLKIDNSRLNSLSGVSDGTSGMYLKPGQSGDKTIVTVAQDIPRSVTLKFQPAFSQTSKQIAPASPQLKIKIK